MQLLLKGPAVVRGPAAPPSPVMGPDIASALVLDAAVSLTPVTSPVIASALMICPVVVTGPVVAPTPVMDPVVALTFLKNPVVTLNLLTGVTTLTVKPVIIPIPVISHTVQPENPPLPISVAPIRKMQKCLQKSKCLAKKEGYKFREDEGGANTKQLMCNQSDSMTGRDGAKTHPLPNHI